jgi:hypothetical protein
VPPTRPPGYWRQFLAERDAGYVTPCLEWTRGRDKYGYGYLTIQHRRWKVHRLVWTEEHGEPPSEMPHVCHHCDNPPCARLDHLFLGTAGDNLRDAGRKGRLGTADTRGEANGLHKLTDADVLAIRASNLMGVDLAEQYGVTPSLVSQVRLHKRWRHLP